MRVTIYINIHKTIICSSLKLLKNVYYNRISFIYSIVIKRITTNKIIADTCIDWELILAIAYTVHTKDHDIKVHYIMLFTRGLICNSLTHYYNVNIDE